jgi:hypothetical protein
MRGVSAKQVENAVFKANPTEGIEKNEVTNESVGQTGAS